MHQGTPEDLFNKETITIENVKIETFTHNNGIIIIPNTESNCKAVNLITTKSIQSIYTILEEREEDPAITTYTKYLYLLKRRTAASRYKKGSADGMRMNKSH
ncbi:hypothetical protein NEPAR06_1207 [Nematocida parisii]|uniref:Uncharacterized protein n=1 Tax=Nematocida parisii (strain ERTm3) TaxID=935791 RepID=I3EK40_NEMP3|nr:uncharacterized protein NEPG_00879 [Nematocida parisii ERTm1]EIJ89587.1 hypothetical protein NEQG_00357 [Nematocida parisii ERTm3]KAI5128618.1 hypothetical protein NEPAR08_1329 [Nematocida parisii]EIJ94212.1 hypothetical protein NEPG_00879 [Nematocida parisii ERTm1]KAI5128958.1 hypothetical protein NEPAR03_1449 [Nematocida parisii]KAI5141488.1 hypothetical protein NEPAR04_0989 [Nematocida parisii]|eukprot:XP_013058708.1 hypothetical protein NEPG_00879 [Nematocida parisii ERTm1]